MDLFYPRLAKKGRDYNAHLTNINLTKENMKATLKQVTVVGSVTLNAGQEVEVIDMANFVLSVVFTEVVGDGLDRKTQFFVRPDEVEIIEEHFDYYRLSDGMLQGWAKKVEGGFIRVETMGNEGVGISYEISRRDALAYSPKGVGEWVEGTREEFNNMYAKALTEIQQP